MQGRKMGFHTAGTCCKGPAFISQIMLLHREWTCRAHPGTLPCPKLLFLMSLSLSSLPLCQESLHNPPAPSSTSTLSAASTVILPPCFSPSQDGFANKSSYQSCTHTHVDTGWFSDAYSFLTELRLPLQNLLSKWVFFSRDIHWSTTETPSTSGCWSHLLSLYTLVLCLPPTIKQHPSGSFHLSIPSFALLFSHLFFILPFPSPRKPMTVSCYGHLQVPAL